MKDLRRNEFIDMLEMAEVLFEEKDNYISCNIPTLGKVTYYSKADKLQINRTNKWEEGGFEFVKNILLECTIEKKSNDVIDKYSISKESIEKCEQIFILIKLAKMTLTEINTLANNERLYLSLWFKEWDEKEMKEMSKNHK